MSKNNSETGNAFYFKLGMVFSGLFTVVALVTETWGNAGILALLFVGFLIGSWLMERGYQRAAMHVIVAVMLGQQLVVLYLYRDTPSIGLIWFLVVPSIVASMGAPKDILFWTPFCIVAMLVSYTFVIDDPAMQHPMTLPNLLGAISFMCIVSYRFVSERKFREQQLTDALALAKAAEQRSTRFLASLSHELRSPMAGILLSSEMLKESAEMSTDDRTSLERLNRSALMATNLLNDVLDLAKVEAGMVELQRSQFDLESLLEELRIAYLPLAQAQNNRLLVLVPPNCPTSWESSAVCIQQVLGNLIGNAIKYTEDGDVVVTFRINSEWLDIHVVDTGLGIAESQQAHIFDPFVSLADMSSTETGLGLTLARDYAELLGAKLELVNSAEGKGSEFRLRIPASEYLASRVGDNYALLEDCQAVPEIQINHIEQRRWLVAWLDAIGVKQDQSLGVIQDDSQVMSLSDLFNVAGLKVARSKPLLESDQVAPLDMPRSPRGLVCDDNDLIREVFSLQLKKLGFDCEASRDQRETLEMLSQQTFDFLLLDLQLGEESGIEILQRIRASGEAWANIPVCIISGSLMEKEEAIALGADDFLLKPPQRGALADMATALSNLAAARQ